LIITQVCSPTYHSQRLYDRKTDGPNYNTDPHVIT
jgi:hypothetical protein